MSSSWSLLLIAIVCEVIATSLLKQTEGFTKPLPTLASLVGYSLAFYFLSLTLKSLPVGIAYAIWSGLGVVLVTLIAWLLYDQVLSFLSLFGIVLIVAGVIIVNLAASK